MASSIRIAYEVAARNPVRRLIIAILIGGLGPARSLPAQSLWEVSPYKIRVWLNLADSPEVPRAWSWSLSQYFVERAQSAASAVWRVSVQPAPTPYRQALLSGTQLDALELLSAHDHLSQSDKLLVLNVQADGGAYVLSAQELDVQTRVWSRRIDRAVHDASAVPMVAFQMLCDVFVPLVDIVRVEGTEVTAEYRAAALAIPPESIRAWKDPARIVAGDVLVPYIRKRDRRNRVTATGVTAVDYTVLVVKQAETGVQIENSDARPKFSIECETFSGYRQPFRVRRSARSQQLALLGRPSESSTTLRAHDRRDKERPLEGYEVYARAPGGQTSEYVGRTDREGKVTISRSDTLVRVLFIKSGTRLLAKLPVVPGLASQVDVPLPNDQSRLEAEGFLIGIQESLVDLVARREILVSRIRANIEKKQFELAQQLIDELRRLPSREDFETSVQQKRQLLSASDAQVQQRIDQLFSETRDLFTKYFDPRQVQQLRGELESARGSEVSLR
jgi:hypothetical protein